VNPHLIDVLDRILSEIEPLLAQLAAEHNLEPYTLERWHSDEPEISLKWFDLVRGPANKSFRFSIEVNRNEEHPYMVMAEINAWLDLDAVGQTLRKWRHQQLESTIRLRGPEEVRDHVFALKDIRDAGYEIVSRWTLEDLSQIDQLPPLSVAGFPTRTVEGPLLA
jgi:hypothetical protein